MYEYLVDNINPDTQPIECEGLFAITAVGLTLVSLHYIRFHRPGSRNITNQTMELEEVQFETVLVQSIQGRQTTILREIELLKRASAGESLRNRDIIDLQEEYNDLVDKRAHLERSPLSDPIEKLPPELWPYIIPVDEDRYSTLNTLLELTLVSKRWCNALVSSPLLWADILLDQSKQDYLAKAAMCITLSGTCEIDVDICVSQDSWKDVAPLIVPEGKRIRSLCLNPVESSFTSNKILSQLGELPKLKELYLMDKRDKRLGNQDLEELGLNHMPSLKLLDGPSISPESKWRHLITTARIYLELCQKETIEQYGKLPGLRDFTIMESEFNSELLSSNALDSLLQYVTNLSYRGFSFSRIVRWFGPRLTRINMDTTNIDSLQDLALSLEPLPRLRSLKLYMSNPLFTYDSGIESPALNSIKTLHLMFMYTSWNDTKENREENAILDAIYEGLINIMPSVRVLGINCGVLTEACVKYVKTLNNLLELEIDYCHIISPNYRFSINAQRLNRLSWSSSSSFPTLLAGMIVPAMRQLQIEGTYDGDTHDPHTLQMIEHRIRSPLYLVSGETFTNLISLVIAASGPVCWKLVSLSSLSELEITSALGEVMVWASDVLEAILMRPYDLPVLETIKLRGPFFDWDVLLLVLERRILCFNLGISHITTLVVNSSLPYKLLHPITSLLQGKLPDRAPNDQYSIDFVGKRLWNENSLGCLGCCYTFQSCGSPTMLIDELHFRSDEKFMPLALDYELPLEFLVAEPPLTPDIMEWLSGKRERRQEFIRECKKTAGSFYREPWCDAFLGSDASIAVTAHSLDGVHFHEDVGAGTWFEGTGGTKAWAELQQPGL